jgi:hypothetical protein
MPGRISSRWAVPVSGLAGAGMGMGMMLERVVEHRADKRFANRLRNAKMRFPNACIADISFNVSRGLDRRQILSLGQGG